VRDDIFSATGYDNLPHKFKYIFSPSVSRLKEDYDQIEARDGEKSRQAATQIAEWLAAAWNGPAYDALAGVCFFFGPRTAMPRRCECGL